MDKAKREAIERRLELMSKRYGGSINTNDVLLEARNPDSPLHEQFEWDDTVAARLFRTIGVREHG